MVEYRTEKDLLGEKQVPKDAYYGIQTMRAQENFPDYWFSPQHRFNKRSGYGEKSCLLSTNWQLGRLNEKIAKAIMQAADESIAEKFNDQFIVDVIQGWSRDIYEHER